MSSTAARIARGSALAFVALIGCRRSEPVRADHAEPIVARDAAPEVVDAPVDAPKPKTGELVVDDPTAELFHVDDVALRWRVTAENVWQYKSWRFDVYEARHDDVTHPKRIAEALQALVHVDAKWLLHFWPPFSASGTLFVVDRETEKARELPRDCAGDSVVDGTRAYVVSICGSHTEVHVFDTTKGQLSPWFVVPQMIEHYAVDANDFYYVVGDTVRKRSRTTSADAVVVTKFVSQEIQVLDGAVLTCLGRLEKWVGGAAVTVAPACRRFAGDRLGLAFTGGGKLYALDAHGKTPRLVAEDVEADALAVSGSWIYFRARDGIRRVPR